MRKITLLSVSLMLISGVLAATATTSTAAPFNPNKFGFGVSQDPFSVKGASSIGRFSSGKTFYVVKGRTISFRANDADEFKYQYERYDSKKKKWNRIVSGTEAKTSVNFKWPHSTGSKIKIRGVITQNNTGKRTVSKTKLFHTMPANYVAPKKYNGKWDLMNTRAGQNPPRWNPCKTIPVKVDPRAVRRGSQSKAINDVKSAINYVNKRTGLKFRYAGRATVDGNVNNLPKGEVVVIRWDSKYRYKNSSGVAAISATSGGENADFRRITRGKVVMNTKEDHNNKFRAFVLRHELFHTAGAGHAKLRGNLMSEGRLPRSPNQNLWGPLDSIMAKSIGKSRGCF